MSYDNLSSVSQNILKFISSLPVKRGGSLSFLTIFAFAVPELLDLIWQKIGFLPYVVNFISSLPVKRGGSLSFLVGTISNVLVMEIGWIDVGSGGYILVSCAHSNTSLSMCDVKVSLTFTSLNLVLLWQLFYLFCSSIVINTVIVKAGTFEP